MLRRSCSLGAGMLAILLIAVNLAAFRLLPWPTLDFAPVHVWVGLVPISNVLAIVGYWYVKDRSARPRLSLPLFVLGPLAILGHVVWVWLRPEQVAWVCRIPEGVVFRLFQAYEVPGTVGITPEGYSYFRYYPMVALLKLGVIQFLVLALGASLFLLVKFARPESAAGSGSPTKERPDGV